MLNWRDPENPLSGGAERVSLAYLTELARRGHEVGWFANAFPGGKPEEDLNGIHYIRGGGKGSSVVKARQWVRRQKPFDLVIDQHHGIPWFAPWWCRTNCIAYIHEVLGPIWSAFYPWPLSVLGRWQERWTHRCYRNVPFWTPAETTRTRLLAHGVRNVFVFPNGCEAKPLAGLEPKLLSTPLQLVSVSRLAPNKRVDHAIRVVKILSDRKIPAQLTVVGTGQSEASLRQTAAELNLGSQVSFLGSLPEPDKDAQLRRAHFLVHTSLREGWGLNVIEANAMGTPAIVYPVDGLRDSTVDGKTGIVTAVETPGAVADGLAAILNQPQAYATLRLNAWNRSKEFQWDKVLPPACDWLEEQARRKNS